MFSPRFLSYQLLFRAVPQGSSCQEEHYLLGCLKFLFEFLLSHTPLPPQAISSILMVSVTKYVRKETSPVQFFLILITQSGRCYHFADYETGATEGVEQFFQDQQQVSSGARWEN